ncbi:DUF1361 domain-containing protein [Flavobacterium sp.]|uniref:DUF1361 domain-containing protein n=1 Tax=Flavobacterium sp. TaxID=239 RepID=UPI00375367D6
MNIIINIFNSNKKINTLVILFSAYCFSLLLLRAKITNSTYLFFLIWNLFLAIIPYFISSYIIVKSKQIKSNLLLVISFICWLLFLPNSFYIITDLVHIVRSTGNLFYLDLIIICSFATIGFLLGLLSLNHFKIFLNSRNLVKYSTYTIPFICILCGFGIYLGRILRYNSWNIISNPFQLFVDLVTVGFTIKSILFTLLFGTFIYLSYLLKQTKI